MQAASMPAQLVPHSGATPQCSTMSLSANLHAAIFLALWKQTNRREEQEQALQQAQQQQQQRPEDAQRHQSCEQGYQQQPPQQQQQQLASELQAAAEGAVFFVGTEQGQLWAMTAAAALSTLHSTNISSCCRTNSSTAAATGASSNPVVGSTGPQNPGLGLEGGGDAGAAMALLVDIQQPLVALLPMDLSSSVLVTPPPATTPAAPAAAGGSGWLSGLVRPAGTQAAAAAALPWQQGLAPPNQGAGFPAAASSTSAAAGGGVSYSQSPTSDSLLLVGAEGAVHLLTCRSPHPPSTTAAAAANGSAPPAPGASAADVATSGHGSGGGASVAGAGHGDAAAAAGAKGATAGGKAARAAADPLVACCWQLPFGVVKAQQVGRYSMLVLNQQQQLFLVQLGARKAAGGERGGGVNSAPAAATTGAGVIGGVGTAVKFPWQQQPQQQQQKEVSREQQKEGFKLLDTLVPVPLPLPGPVSSFWVLPPPTDSSIELVEAKELALTYGLCPSRGVGEQAGQGLGQEGPGVARERGDDGKVEIVVQLCCGVVMQLRVPVGEAVGGLGSVAPHVTDSRAAIAATGAPFQRPASSHIPYLSTHAAAGGGISKGGACTNGSSSRESSSSSTMGPAGCYILAGPAARPSMASMQEEVQQLLKGLEVLATAQKLLEGAIRGHDAFLDGFQAEHEVMVGLKERGLQALKPWNRSPLDGLGCGEGVQREGKGREGIQGQKAIGAAAAGRGGAGMVPGHGRGARANDAITSSSSSIACELQLQGLWAASAAAAAGPTSSDLHLTVTINLTIELEDSLTTSGALHTPWSTGGGLGSKPVGGLGPGWQLLLSFIPEDGRVGAWQVTHQLPPIAAGQSFSRNVLLPLPPSREAGAEGAGVAGATGQGSSRGKQGVLGWGAGLRQWQGLGAAESGWQQQQKEVQLLQSGWLQVYLVKPSGYSPYAAANTGGSGVAAVALLQQRYIGPICLAQLQAASAAAAADSWGPHLLLQQAQEAAADYVLGGGGLYGSTASHHQQEIQQQQQQRTLGGMSGGGGRGGERSSYMFAMCFEGMVKGKGTGAGEEGAEAVRGCYPGAKRLKLGAGGIGVVAVAGIGDVAPSAAAVQRKQEEEEEHGDTVTALTSWLSACLGVKDSGGSNAVAKSGGGGLSGSMELVLGELGEVSATWGLVGGPGELMEGAAPPGGGGMGAYGSSSSYGAQYSGAAAAAYSAGGGVLGGLLGGVGSRRAGGRGEGSSVGVIQLKCESERVQGLAAVHRSIVLGLRKQLLEQAVRYSWGVGLHNCRSRTQRTDGMYQNPLDNQKVQQDRMEQAGRQWLGPGEHKGMQVEGAMGVGDIWQHGQQQQGTQGEGEVWAVASSRGRLQQVLKRLHRVQQMVLQLRHLSEEVLEAREMCSREGGQGEDMKDVGAWQEDAGVLGQGWEGEGVVGVGGGPWQDLVEGVGKLHQGCEAVYGRMLLLLAGGLKVQVR